MSSDYVFVRDDEETELFVTYHMVYGGCPAHYGSLTYAGHPEEAPEFAVDSVENSLGYEVSSMLTEAEWERLENEVFEHGCARMNDGPDD